MTKYTTTNPGSKSVYHLDEDCKRIKGDTKEATKEEIEWHDLTLCEWCDNPGTAMQSTDHDLWYQDILKNNE